MDYPSLTLVAVLALAVVLGGAAVLVLLRQLELQRRAQYGAPEASLFNRLTNCGLGMSLVFGAVLTAKAVAATVSYETFMFTSIFSGLCVLFGRLRSNSTVKRDARKNGARPLP